MNVVEKEFTNRKSEIQTELELLFKANMKITDWDVAEADDQKAAEILLSILQEKLDSIKINVESGKYINY